MVIIIIIPLKSKRYGIRNHHWCPVVGSLVTVVTVRGRRPAVNKQSVKNLKFSQYVITVNKLFLINHHWNNRETRAPHWFS